MTTSEAVIQAARAVLRHEDDGCSALHDGCSASSHDQALRDALAAHDAAGKVEWVRVDEFRERTDLPNGKWLGVFADGTFAPQWNVYDRGERVRSGQAGTVELAKAAAEAAAGAK